MATTQDGLAEGIFDYAAMFMSAGSVTATVTVPSSGIKVRGTGLKGSAVRVHFPATSGTREQVLVEIHGSVDDSTYRVVSTHAGGAISWASGDEQINVPFTLPKGYFYAKMKFTVTGGTTTAGAGYVGGVYAGIVPRVDGEWTRVVRFD